MKSQDSRECMMQIMSHHARCIDNATGYLDEIKQAFVENRLQELQDLLAEPRFDLAEIESLEQERHRLLTEFGFKQCIEWCDDPDRKLSSLYLELIDKLKSLQQAIQVNNLLFSKGKDRVRRSIGVLTGVAASSCKTYSSSGQTIDSARRRNLAIA